LNDEVIAAKVNEKECEDALNKSIKGFELLAEIHQKNQQYPEAAAILWYAKRLAKSDTFDQKIEAVEQEFFSTKLNSKTGYLGLDQAKLDQQKLADIREAIRTQYDTIKAYPDKLNEMRALQLKITADMKGFIAELAQSCVEQLKCAGRKPPCPYAIIGLGSLAREEMTPYSDFEFGILIDSENEADKHYFRLLTDLLYLRFINLGETILPSMDIVSLSWVYDDITPRGLAFDGSMASASKTARGKQKGVKGDYELIHHPAGMGALQKLEEGPEQERIWALKRYHLPTILSNVTYVTGSQEGKELVTEYQSIVRHHILQEGKQRADWLMKDDLSKFKPRFEEESSGKGYDVKKDLYRLPNTMFDGLANYYNLSAASSWERIEELEQKDILSCRARISFNLLGWDLMVLYLVWISLRIALSFC
jgi:hypothetical protein